MISIRNCLICKKQTSLKELPCCKALCCKECFTYHITQKICDNIDVEQIPCINSQCLTKYTFDFITNIIGDQDEAFQIVINAESFVLKYEPSIQECEICCGEFDKRDFIRLECGHKACKGCVTNWLYQKYNETKGNFSIEETGCISGDCNRKDVVNPVLLFTLFSKPEAEKVMNYTIEGYFNFQCPSCYKKFEYKDQVSNDDNLQKIQCPYCQKAICALCKMEFHQGPCQNLQQQLRRAIGYSSFFSYCPYCFTGPNLKDDNCEHVTCKSCKKDFCFFCWCPREPTIMHGNHYHRKECIFYQPWVNPITKKEQEDEFNPGCSFCQKFNKVCPKPIPFEQFLINLKMSKETIKREIKKKNDRKEQTIR